METGLAFWSWFNLAVTPIADALKWLRRIVSAWWDLQLGGTSAPAAAPLHPFDLQIWHAQSLGLVGSQHKQFPLQDCKYFYEMNFNWATRWSSTVNISRTLLRSIQQSIGKGTDQSSKRDILIQVRELEGQGVESSEKTKKAKRTEWWKKGRRDSDSHEREIYNQIIN